MIICLRDAFSGIILALAWLACGVFRRNDQFFKDLIIHAFIDKSIYC